MKKIRFMDTSFRDGFQSCLGARVRTTDFIPVLEAASQNGISHFEIGGGARFQSLYFYCQEDAFNMMNKARQVVGPQAHLQTLSRGVNVVGLSSQSSDIIDLHARLFKKHGISHIRNFDALNDVNNLNDSGNAITKAGLHHQVVVTLMSLPPGITDNYNHKPAYYIDTLKRILNEGVPFDSVCFKDASGTSTPRTVYDTIKGAKSLLPKNVDIQFHTHCTAGIAVTCYMAAIEAGVDIIDLAMAPVSGGTSQPDILTMWHALQGSTYTLDIDYKKILDVEALFKERLKNYFLPPESKEVSPIIPLSPMPGGALTANTAMMRDNKCMHLFPKVIQEMENVVEHGGFGTSVTPVSQFYFQQAFANVTQGPWKKITDGYGKMVLGYFGKTPAKPDPEIIKKASIQLNLTPTKTPVITRNDQNEALGIKHHTKILKENDIPVTDENIFISATCGEKGIRFLKGNAPLGIRTKEIEEKEVFNAYIKKHPELTPKAPPSKKQDGSYNIKIDGETYHVTVSETEDVQIKDITKKETNTSKNPIKAPMPGTILKVLQSKGSVVKSGDPVFLIEAMKMEVEIQAPFSGHISSINVSEGDTVQNDQVIGIIS